MIGQLRDLQATGATSTNLDAALKSIRFKTTTYTIDYPLRLGATLANASQSVLAACSAYAVPLGEAFQLRDDLLGLFGDPDRTGKSATGDLRTGKATVLMALALRTAAPAQRHRSHALVGDETIDAAGAETIRGILKDTGTVAAVEQLILNRRAEALAALESDAFPSEPRVMPGKLAIRATNGRPDAAGGVPQAARTPGGHHRPRRQPRAHGPARPRTRCASVSRASLAGTRASMTGTSAGTSRSSFNCRVPVTC